MSDSFSPKLLPYGIASFTQIREEGLLYVDKTRFIRKLEERGLHFPLIVRPRRFGKTLFTRTLEAYYDKAQAADFEKYFKGLDIYSKPTPGQGQYYVLHFNFSGIDIEHLILQFNQKLDAGFTDFFRRYPELRMPSVALTETMLPVEFLNTFLKSVGEAVRRRLYIIIDEYDHFANKLLATSPKRFQEVTGKDGFLKNFYSRIKEATDESLVARTFITGVTSISLDSMTSGFSIAEDITQDINFCDLFGFNEEELFTVIDETVDLKACKMDRQEVFARMQDYYNGYRFNKSFRAVPVFNSSSSLYYLRSLSLDHQEPEPLADKAGNPDLAKLADILQYGDQEFIRDTIKTVIEGRPVRFVRFNNAINLNEKERLNNTDVLSVLFYLGYLTYSPNNGELVCPNKSVRNLFLSYYLNRIEGYDFDLSQDEVLSVVDGLHNGTVIPLFNEISMHLKRGTGVSKHKTFNESNIQTAIKMATSLTTDYDVREETEALGVGFADLVLVPLKPQYPSYLIELKNIKSADLTPHRVEAKLAEAQDQLRRYAASENFSRYDNLKKVAAVFSDFEFIKSVSLN